MGQVTALRGYQKAGVDSRNYCVFYLMAPLDFGFEKLFGIFSDGVQVFVVMVGITLTRLLYDSKEDQTHQEPQETFTTLGNMFGNFGDIFFQSLCLTEMDGPRADF